MSREQELMEMADEKLKMYERSKDEEEQMGKETAARFSTGKIRFDLVPPWCLQELSSLYLWNNKI